MFLLLKYGGFPFQNDLKDVDPFCKTDLDIWDCFERESFILKLTFARLIYIFAVILEM